MATKTNICNMAIAHLGTGDLIGNVDTDTTVEGVTCNLFYDDARRKVLADCPWSFARKEQALGLVATLSDTDADAEWTYSYRYPSDCVDFLRIKSGIRQDTRQSRVPYKILKDESGKLIYSDEQNAQGEYTIDVETASFYPSDFVLAFSYKLAELIAPVLAKGNTGVKREMMQFYLAEISNAMNNNRNEDQPGEKPVSEFERVRD
jgi:hypothetical protein